MDSTINGGKLDPVAVFRRDASARTAGAITESLGGYAIADTSTTAVVGDIYKAVTSGNSAMVNKEYRVISASTNSFTIASKDLPVAGDTFFILGPVTQRFDNTGSSLVSISTAGLATEAKQDVGNTSLASIDTKTPALGQAVMASSTPVVLASNQTSIPVAATLAAETTKVIGTINIAAAQTLATVTTVGTVTNITNQGQLVDNAAFTDGTTRLMMAGFIFDETAGTALTENDGAAARVDSKRAIVHVIEDATTRGQRLAVSSVGAAAANTTQINGVTLLAGNGVTGTGSQRVTIASDNTPFPIKLDQTTPGTTNAISIAQLGANTISTGNGVSGTGVQRVTIASDSTGTIKQAGKSIANSPVRNDYTSTAVTTGAYVQLVASLTSACTEIEIFDSSGQTLKIATGGAGSEVDQINIFPGGNGRIPLAIAAGTRVSVRAVSATASVGELDINFYS